MLYSIRIAPHARRDLKKIPLHNRSSIIRAIDTLSANPRPAGCKKLEGTKSHAGIFRIVVDEFRIVYSIQNDKLIVLIITIGHRKEVYKRITRLIHNILKQQRKIS